MLFFTKVKYEKETDILYITLSDEKIEESDEDKKGFILDYSKNGNLVGIEVLNASKSSINLTKLNKMLPNSSSKLINFS
ncbi:MAG TPA: hypothetical protein DCM02_00175 [Flavobacterium sp.]|nr:hypothetical protein [Flavobacterium sp.]